MAVFNKITITDEERRRRRIINSTAAVLLTAAFTAGFLTVYIRSYNIMHKEPMVLLEVDETQDGYSVVVFNRRFDIKNRMYP